MDYASLYPTTMKKIDLKVLRKQDRKSKIKSIYGPS